MSVSLTSLKGKLDRKLFNADVFRGAERIEKIMMVMVAGPKGQYRLTAKEREYASLLEDAYTLIKEYRSQSIATKMLRAKIAKDSSSHYSAIQVMNDAVNLFGRFEQVNRPIQRGIIRDNLLERIKVCEKEMDDAEDKERPQWEKLLQGYWKQLAELDQVSILEEKGEVDNTLPEIILTTDPAALMDSMAEDAEIDNDGEEE